MFCKFDLRVCRKRLLEVYVISRIFLLKERMLFNLVSINLVLMFNFQILLLCKKIINCIIILWVLVFMNWQMMKVLWIWSWFGYSIYCLKIKWFIDQNIWFFVFGKNMVLKYQLVKICWNQFKKRQVNVMKKDILKVFMWKMWFKFLRFCCKFISRQV